MTRENDKITPLFINCFHNSCIDKWNLHPWDEPNPNLGSTLFANPNFAWNQVPPKSDEPNLGENLARSTKLGLSLVFLFNVHIGQIYSGS
jgi:hypothetical protein